MQQIYFTFICCVNTYLWRIVSACLLVCHLSRVWSSVLMSAKDRGNFLQYLWGSRGWRCVGMAETLLLFGITSCPCQRVGKGILPFKKNSIPSWWRKWGGITLVLTGESGLGAVVVVELHTLSFARICYEYCCCYCLFSYFIAVSSKLFLFQPVIFVFCVSNRRGSEWWHGFFF